MTRIRGGQLAHYLRRLVHIAIFIIPLLYYQYGESIAGFFHLQIKLFLLILLGLTIVIELLRLKFGFLAFGQRDYEKKQISAFAWTIFAIIVVLLLAPGRAYGIPIVWCCAFVDPLIGELRRFAVNELIIWLVGIIAVMAIWWIATVWLGTPWWYALVMGPLIVAAERPQLRWIDDNALMQLVPLLFVLISHFYLFPFKS